MLPSMLFMAAAVMVFWAQEWLAAGFCSKVTFAILTLIGGLLVLVAGLTLLGSMSQAPVIFSAGRGCRLRIFWLGLNFFAHVFHRHRSPRDCNSCPLRLLKAVLA